MTEEEIYIEEAGVERDDICRGKIIVVFSGISKKRRANLYSYVSGAIKAMKHNNPKVQNLNNHKEEKKEEEKTPLLSPPLPAKPCVVRGPQVTNFLRSLTCLETEVIGSFNTRFPGNTSNPDKILSMWRKLHPVIAQTTISPMKPGDHVRYCKGLKRDGYPTGVVEEIGSKNTRKMLVRFGVSDLQYVNIDDYEKVE